MTLTQRLAAGAVLLLSLAACTTQIQNRDETIVPPKQRFGSFKPVALRPLTVDKMEGDSGDLAAVKRIDTDLQACLGQVFPSLITGSDPAPAAALVITPTIDNLKKVNTAERIFAGALAGSSAVLLKLDFTAPDGSGGRKELSAPIFYAKANAMGAAWTFGATDNLMLERVVTNACDYARANY